MTLEMVLKCLLGYDFTEIISTLNLNVQSIEFLIDFKSNFNVFVFLVIFYSFLFNRLFDFYFINNKTFCYLSHI